MNLHIQVLFALLITMLWYIHMVRCVYNLELKVSLNVLQPTAGETGADDDKRTFFRQFCDKVTSLCLILESEPENPTKCRASEASEHWVGLLIVPSSEWMRETKRLACLDYVFLLSPGSHTTANIVSTASCTIVCRCLSAKTVVFSCWFVCQQDKIFVKLGRQRGKRIRFWDQSRSNKRDVTRQQIKFRLVLGLLRLDHRLYKRESSPTSQYRS